MDQKDEIKSKLDLVEVIREYIQLKAVGVNFQALCPLHREKTPSFVVSPERQIWKCFGCGKGGDAFSFVMEMEGLSFVEALRQLAPKAGVTLRRQNAREMSRRNRLLDCMETAVDYYHRLLLEAPQANAAREYLQSRGLDESTIAEFKIGYSRDSWDDLYGLLHRKGFADEDIFLSGLTVKKDKSLGYYNRFRGRIMFPIFDVGGNAIAFSARVSPEREASEKQGKYINSPQSPLYDKSNVLFGLDKARQAIRQEDQVIVVEGQMDVISSHRVGVKQVVASSGTALSAQQVKLLRRYTANVLFAFDMDSAGELAAERGIEQALQADMNIRVIQLPGGKDPDECICHNPADWSRAVSAAVGVMDYYFTKTFAGRDTSDMARKKAAAAKLLNVMRHIVNPIEQDTWLRRLSEILMVQEDSLRNVLRTQLRRAKHPAGRALPATESVRSAAPAPVQSHVEVLTDSLLALSLKFFVYFEQVVRMVTPEMLAGESRRSVYKMLVMYYSSTIRNNGAFDSRSFARWLEHNIKDEQGLASMRDVTDTLLLLADKDFYDLDAVGAKVHIQRISLQLKRSYLSDQLLRLERDVSTAEQEGNTRDVALLMERVSRIINEIKMLNV